MHDPGREFGLVFRRGRIPRPRGARNVRQVMNGAEGRPEALRRIEAMFPELDRIELFPRSPRTGWTPWRPTRDSAR